MILGVSLVVNELHKGPRLVFRYPPAPSSLNSSKTSPTTSQLEGIYEQYLTKISDPNFSKLFRPKNSLCGKVLEMEIDDLHFVSFPCHCSDTNTNISSSGDIISASIQGSSSKNNLAGADAANVEGKQAAEVITLFNIVIATVSRKAIRRIDPQFLYRCQKGRQMSSFSAACSYPGVDPIAAAMALPDSSDRAYGVCNQVLRRVVENVSNSLLQQEKKCNYVSSEVGLLFRMIALSHDLLHQHQRMAVANATTGSTESYSHGYLAEMTIGLDNLLRGGSVSSPCSAQAQNPSKFTASSSDSNIQETVELLDGSPSVRLSLPFGEAESGGSSSSGGGGGASTYPSLTPGNPPSSTANTTGRPAVATAPPAAATAAASTSSAASSTVANSSGSADSSDGGDVADEIISWGPHLLPIALKYSTLANELRILFHNLVGGHSVCIALNGQKAMNIPLVCKEVKLCYDSTYITRTNSDSDGLVYGNNMWGTALKVSNGIDMAADLSSSMTSPVGNANRTLTSSDSTVFHHLPSSRSRGGATASSPSLQSSGDYNNSKFKGIKLRTQTMLPMADVEVIMCVLSVLDGGKINHPGIGDGSSSVHSSKKEADYNGQSSTEKDGDVHVVGGTTQSVGVGNKQLTKSRLYTFIEAADPTQCFLDLSMMLDEPVEELVSMATYLQSWGLAQIISVIYSHSTYRVHELAQSTSYSAVFRIFDTFISSKIGYDLVYSNGEQQEEGPVRSGSAEEKEKEKEKGTAASPRVDLAYVLSLFDGMRSITAIVDVLPAEVKEFGLDILIFLLRYHMVTPVTQHVLNLKNLRVCIAQSDSNINSVDASKNHSNTITIAHSKTANTSSIHVSTGITSDSAKTSAKLSRNVSFHVDVRDDEQRYKAVTANTINTTTNLAYRGERGGAMMSSNSSSMFPAPAIVTSNSSSSSWPTYHLNEQENSIYERIAPFVQHHTYSSKSIHEIMLYAKVGAKEFFDLLAKLPHLKVVSV